MTNFFLISIFLLTSVSFAAGTEDNKSIRAKKQIKIEMEREKRYAKEQTFYQNDNYDFKGSEVNKESLDTLPEIEVDDLDMDSVYD